MAERTFLEMFPEVLENESETKKVNKATEQLLSSHSKKNKMISLRVNNDNYSRFTELCGKKGVSASAVINIMISKFIDSDGEL